MLPYSQSTNYLVVGTYCPGGNLPYIQITSIELSGYLINDLWCIENSFIDKGNKESTFVAVAPEERSGATYRPELDSTLWPESIVLPSHSNNVQRRSRNGKGWEQYFA